MSYRPLKCPDHQTIVTIQTERDHYCEWCGKKMVPEERRKGERRAPPPGDGGLRDFEAGRVKVDMDGPYKGWVSVRHADGQWVTAAKLEPFSMAILSYPLAALGRPAETSARDEEGGWHDTTPSPAETQGDVCPSCMGSGKSDKFHTCDACKGTGKAPPAPSIMQSVKLCTCEIITGGQMVGDPACPFHHAPAPSETGKKPPEDFATRSEGTSALKRWRYECSNILCGIVRISINYFAVFGTCHVCKSGQMINQGPTVESAEGPGDEEARLIAGGTEALPE